MGRVVPPKDTLGAPVHRREQAGYDFDLLRGVIEANDTPARRAW